MVKDLAYEFAKKYGARHYFKYPFVAEEGSGAILLGHEPNEPPLSKRVIDLLAAYSAVNQGHCHPEIVAADQAQAAKLGVTGNPFYNNQTGYLLKKMCELSNMEAALLKNGGVEAVEVAIKAMRRWGYNSKGVEDNKAEIIVAENNFHGRTTTVISFSSDAESRDGFGPYTPGFRSVPFNNASALEAAINENTVGVLLEPVQGEAGVIIPDMDYLPKVRKLCSDNNVLLCLDEIQTGLGRTGKVFCFEHYGVRPDMVIMGKALSGGQIPVSGIATSRDIMDTAFFPGNEGSTYGEYVRAGAVGRAALEVLLRPDPITGMNLVERSADVGFQMGVRLSRMRSKYKQLVKEVRGIGMMLAMEFYTDMAHHVSETLLERGVWAKPTHGNILRISPPLMIEDHLIDEAFTELDDILNEYVSKHSGGPVTGSGLSAEEQEAVDEFMTPGILDDMDFGDKE